MGTSRTRRVSPPVIRQSCFAGLTTRGGLPCETSVRLLSLLVLRAGLDELHAHCRWWPISLTSLDSARRPETPGRTLADTGENICKPHTERLRVGIEPTTFLLWWTIHPPPLLCWHSPTRRWRSDPYSAFINTCQGRKLENWGDRLDPLLVRKY